jgi:hypothetical protein
LWRWRRAPPGFVHQSFGAVVVESELNGAATNNGTGNAQFLDQSAFTVGLGGAFACVGWWAASRPWYRARAAMPACMVIALVASCWTFERVFESLGQRL